MKINKPYLYFIGWPTLKRYYVGVRYSKNSYVGDIWERYFTSSSHVKTFAKENGKPDIVKVLNIFDTPEEARNAEIKFITTFNIIKSEYFLNKHCPGERFVNPGGWKHSEKWKINASIRQKGNKFGKAGKGRALTDLHKHNISQSTIGRLFTNESKLKMSISAKIRQQQLVKVIHNGIELEFASLTELALYLGVSENQPGRWIKHRGIPKKFNLEIIEIASPKR